MPACNTSCNTATPPRGIYTVLLMRRRFVTKILLPGVLLTAASFGVWLAPAHAEFLIKKVTAQQVSQRLLVSADMDLSLTSEAQAAVDNGVPLVVLTEFEVKRPGAFWDATLLRRKLRGRLRYHALSDRYIVERADTSEIEIFRSLDSALRHLGRIRGLQLDIAGQLPVDSLLAVRSRLDINALPAPLRPMALFSADWRLSSDWTQWRIDH